MHKFYLLFSAKKWLLISFIQILIVIYISLELIKIFDQKFSLTVFNVTDGDAMLLKTPKGHNIIIDSGINGKIASEIFKKKTFFDRTIDALILTHPHDDHIGGAISLIEQFNIKAVFLSGIESKDNLYKEIIDKASLKNVPIYFLNSQSDIKAEEIGLDIIYPINNFTGKETKNLNNSSLVIRIEALGKNILLSGDIEKEVEKELLLVDNPLKSDYLKVGHHGSKTSSTEKFLDAVEPKIAIISASKDNKFGHPHKETINKLDDKNIETYITKDIGNFTVKISPNSEKIYFDKFN